MSLTPTPCSASSELFMTMAVTGLVGSCTQTLQRLQSADALAMLDAVSSGAASFVWTVEAQGDVATVKTEFVAVDGRTLTLATMSVDLNLSPDLTKDLH